MGTTFAKFDTTVGNLVNDLVTRILVSSDWAEITPSTQLLATNAGTAAAATSLPFTSTTGFPLTVGQVIAIDTGVNREYRPILTITGTAITVAALSLAHASGTGIFVGSRILKATTTRGAQMVVDLQSGSTAAPGVAPALNNLSVGFYRSHDGTVSGGVDFLQRWLYWRSTGGATTHPLHVVVSAGKEHLWVSVEGPRPGETGVVSATYGSLRGYLFIQDVEPYHASDTVPAVCAGSSQAAAQAAAIATSYIANVSRNQAANGSWVTARLMTLAFPQLLDGSTYNYPMDAVGDGKAYVFPYIVMEEADGLRGRLAKLWYAGVNDSSLPAGEQQPLVGRKITYSGEQYELTPTVKNADLGGSNNVWGPLGSVANAVTTTSWRSQIIAVPSP